MHLLWIKVSEVEAIGTAVMFVCYTNVLLVVSHRVHSQYRSLVTVIVETVESNDLDPYGIMKVKTVQPALL